MVLRAFAWHAILRAALPRARVRLRDALQGTFIGVLMSATLPARLGEPSRAFVVARRIGSAREHLPVVLGTIVSQTLLNILALDRARDRDVLDRRPLHAPQGAARRGDRAAGDRRLAAAGARAAALRQALALRARRRRFITQARAALVQLRGGLTVFRRPRLGALATRRRSCRRGSCSGCRATCCSSRSASTTRAGLGAAAAVLFAVNVTAVLPATPSNVGIFQAACVAVLAAYGVGYADALAYGIILQAVEIATAVVMGAPALVKEGLSWREVRLRAMHSSPVELAPVRALRARRGAASRPDADARGARQQGSSAPSRGPPAKANHAR